MQENFLHYLWRTRRFDLSDLQTTEGEPLEILDFGLYNALDAGADFQNAKIRIGGLTWCGNVEMHLKSSDWLAHGHQRDAAYENVILHVVYENDKPIVRANNALKIEAKTESKAASKSNFWYSKPENSNTKLLNSTHNTQHPTPQNTEGEQIACLELKNRIPSGVFQNYWALQNNAHWIPCQFHFYKVAEMTKTMWLERLLVERLERKATAIAATLEQNKGDWEETFWQFTARYFGSKVNAEPMEILARQLPHLVLAKHKNQLHQIEALLFGQAGFLEKPFVEPYPLALQKEYDFLRHKHQLTPSVSTAAWKFSRLRPASFPTIRLAQLAQLIHQSSHLFSKIIDNQQVSDYPIFFEIEIGNYWLDHFQLDTPSVFKQKKLGKDTIEMILVNVVAPFLFVYGKLRGEEDLKNRAFELMEFLKPEKNAITEGWQTLGFSPKSAAQTQALIQLKTNYCDQKRCVECAIGDAVLKN